MITKESIFSKKNCAAAIEHMRTRVNGGGTDKLPMTEFLEYWEANKNRIIEQVYSMQYSPGLIQEYDIINGKGKRRRVIKMNDTDRLITRLLAQKLNSFYNPRFLPNSCAYQEEKGTLFAAQKARDYIEDGNEYVVEIDIKDFFDSISIERLINILQQDIKDEVVMYLIRQYLYCRISHDGEVEQKRIGILQGSSMSPVFSNLYFDKLDQYMERNEFNWIRFADNIYIYVNSIDLGKDVYRDICQVVKSEFFLNHNEAKSGVYDVYERRMLGYDFKKKGKQILVEKHIYQPKEYYRNWHPCLIQKVNKEYHLTKNGIINKKDYALLFETDTEKYHIPVEATEQLNIYNDVIVTSQVLRALSHEKVRLGVFDRYGDILGYFVPEGYIADSRTVIAQCREYNDASKRLRMTKKMENAAIHNIRANVRYYNKKKDVELSDTVEQLSGSIKRINECRTVDEILLEEARCRQAYYQIFNLIIEQPGFTYEKRTRRPPLDPVNAMISFGNTLLYNRIQQMIWRTSLDSRIGVFHAANRRHYSLNLDFADIYKPIIVDRVIFKLINRCQIRQESFVTMEDGAVYLNEEGKRLFIREFEGKLRDKITIKEKTYTYEQVIENDIRAYVRHLIDGEDYKPYKYY